MGISRDHAASHLDSYRRKDRCPWGWDDELGFEQAELYWKGQQGTIEHHKFILFYPLRSKQVVVKGPKALPGIIAAVCPAHEILQHKPYVDEADVVIRWQVALEEKKPCLRPCKNAFQVWSSSHTLGISGHSWLPVGC